MKKKTTMLAIGKKRRNGCGTTRLFQFEWKNRTFRLYLEFAVSYAIVCMQKLHGCDRKVYTISVESNCTWIPSERILQGYEKNKEKDGR